jgi:DNA-binding response OmpR family regulator
MPGRPWRRAPVGFVVSRDTGHSHERRHPTILIVDDDAVAVEIFTHILKADGYQVFAAADAESGLQYLSDTIPDAVVLDLHLPLADGVEFLRLCRARVGRAEVPVAIVTGDYFIEEQVTKELQALGARVHFKPLWEEDLVRLIRDLTTRPRATPDPD